MGCPCPLSHLQFSLFSHPFPMVPAILSSPHRLVLGCPQHPGSVLGTQPLHTQSGSQKTLFSTLSHPLPIIPPISRFPQNLVWGCHPPPTMGVRLAPFTELCGSHIPPRPRPPPLSHRPPDPQPTIPCSWFGGSYHTFSRPAPTASLFRPPHPVHQRAPRPQPGDSQPHQ